MITSISKINIIQFNQQRKIKNSLENKLGNQLKIWSCKLWSIIKKRLVYIRIMIMDWIIWTKNRNLSHFNLEVECLIRFILIRQYQLNPLQNIDKRLYLINLGLFIQLRRKETGKLNKKLKWKKETCLWNQLWETI